MLGYGGSYAAAGCVCAIGCASWGSRCPSGVAASGVIALLGLLLRLTWQGGNPLTRLGS